MTSPSEMDQGEIGALLVFLANETLTGDERRKVEQAVAADPDLQTQLAALRRVRAEMQAESLAASPGEFGLARLMRDISREAHPAGLRTAGGTAGHSRLWQMAAAAAIALLALQSVWLWTTPDRDIRLAGGGESAVQGPTIIVAFSGAASEASIRALLLELDLTIVSGPSALGLYTLMAPDAAARDRALTRLLDEPVLVESAEPGE